MTIMITAARFGRLIFVVVTSLRMWSTSEDCSFPRSWHGRWLESGTVSVIITSQEFSSKGICFDQHKDYFLVENRLEHCHRCLLITTRHNNVIEYQQSYCIGRQSLQSICAQILVSGDNFFTLVREAAIPVPCPFQKPFHFIYNNNSLCYCRSPMSYLRHCSDETKMTFGFRKCRNCALTYDRDMTFQCLASWEMGRDNLAIGAFLDDSSIRTTYHCLTYHMYDSVMYVVMATGLQCHDFLRYPKEGLLTMELTKDVYGWPPASCTYPGWLTAHAWNDVLDVLQYTFGADNDVMYREVRRHGDVTPSGNSSGRLLVPSKSIFKCLKITPDESVLVGSSLRTVDVLTQVLENCHTSYQCVRFQRRETEVPPFLILLQNSVNVGDSENCSVESFYQNNSRILVSQNLAPGSCPFTGRYISSVDNRGCQLELQSGCHNQSTMTIKSSCQDHDFLQLNCMKWWSVQQKLFLLATVQMKPSDHQHYTCYSFYSHNGSMRISHEENCDFFVSSFDSDMIYEFDYKLEHCLSNSNPDNTRPSTPPLPASGADDPPPGLPFPPKSTRLIHDSKADPDPQLRDEAETSPRLNHLSASAYSAAAVTVIPRICYATVALFICVRTAPL